MQCAPGGRDCSDVEVFIMAAACEEIERGKKNGRNKIM
jgi:hypothetical protein